MYNLSFKITRNSIAYALAKDSEIVEAKVHSFPISYDAKDGSSLQNNRASLRSGRIRLLRKKLLRSFVKNVYKRNGLQVPNLLHKPWEYRSEALKRLLTDDELYTIFYHLTKIRGYKSNRLDGSISDPKDNQKRELAFVEMAKEWDRNLYPTFGSYIYNSKSKSSDNFPTLRNKMGEYTLSTKREWIEDELVVILEKQREFGNPALTEEFCKQIVHAIISQRPLKSIREKVRNCPLMPDHKVATLSGKTSYIFTFWAKMNNLRAFDSDGELVEIPHEKKQLILHHLLNKKTIKYSEISKILDLPSETTYSSQKKDKEDNIFYSFEKYYKFKKSLLKTEEGKKFFDIVDTNPWLYEKVSKVLSYIFDEEEMREAFKNLNFLSGFSPEFIQSLIDITYFKGTHAFSHSAMEYMIKYMEKGETLRAAIKIGKFTNHFVDKVGVSSSKMQPFMDIGSPIVSRALNYSRKILNSILNLHGIKKLNINIISDRTQIAGNINQWMVKAFASAIREQFGFDNQELRIGIKRVELELIEKDCSYLLQDTTPLFEYSFNDDLKQVLTASQVCYFTPERYQILESLYKTVNASTHGEWKGLDPAMTPKEKAIYLSSFREHRLGALYQIPQDFTPQNKHFIRELCSKPYVFYHEDKSTNGEVHLQKYLRVLNPSDDLIYVNDIKEVNGVRTSTIFKRIHLQSLTLDYLKGMVALNKRENLDLFILLKERLLAANDDPLVAFPNGWIYHPSMFRQEKDGRKIYFKVYGISIYDFSACALRVKENLYANLSSIKRLDVYSNGDEYRIIPQYAYNFLTKNLNTLNFVHREFKPVPNGFDFCFHLYKRSFVEVTRSTRTEEKIFSGYLNRSDVFSGTGRMIDVKVETRNLETGEITVEYLAEKAVKLDTADKIVLKRPIHMTGELIEVGQKTKFCTK